MGTELMMGLSMLLDMSLLRLAVLMSRRRRRRPSEDVEGEDGEGVYDLLRCQYVESKQENSLANALVRRITHCQLPVCP